LIAIDNDNDEGEGDALMHNAFRPCAVIEVQRERIDAIHAYGIDSIRE
jgi:hypothetical protein